MKKTSLLFVSDFITKPFNKFLKDYDVKHHDIGQIEQVLMSKVHSDILIIILESEISMEKLELLESLLTEFRAKNRTKIIISNISKTCNSITASLNIKAYEEVLKLNQKIDSFMSIADLNVLNIFDLTQHHGVDKLYNLKNKLLFQTAFTKVGFELIAAEITRVVELFYTKRKKVIVLDADNTLWGGIVGEDGVEGVVCDENYPGIIYKKFQEQLKELLQSGIVLTMASKNNFDDVKELFEKKKMPLAWEDILIKKINWTPKSQNIKEIAKELNVGLESLLFIDDSDFEVNEVRESLGIDVLQVKTDNLIENLTLLSSNLSLKAINLTAEDEDKQNQYKAQQQREKVSQNISSIDDFISSLNIELEFWINNKSQIQRVTQLINKTNQFNLTTRRYSESEVLELMKEHKIFSFQVKDKFGDMGIISIAIIKNNHIDLWLMSCRALGRKIEQRIMDIILDSVSFPLTAEFIKSPKNSQVEDLYERLGFEVVSRDKTSVDYRRDER